jgi:hypothetical protein
VADDPHGAEVGDVRDRRSRDLVERRRVVHRRRHPKTDVGEELESPALRHRVRLRVLDPQPRGLLARPRRYRLLEQPAPLEIRLPPRGDVAHEAGEQRRLRAPDARDRQLGREGGPVRAQRVELEAPV